MANNRPSDARMAADHDFHIHSFLSSCSTDETQIPENILKVNKANGIKKLCVTDHFWDETVPGASEWYKPQNFAHLSENLPLPQDDEVEFYFGCEADMDSDMRIGISRECIDKFDFVIVSTTHLHMCGFTITEEDYYSSLERHKQIYLDRIECLLDKNFPFEKMGIGHLTRKFIAMNGPDDHIDVLNMITDDEFRYIFTKSAKKGIGIELNLQLDGYTDKQVKDIMRPYHIAKECGNRFYLGSDAHRLTGFNDSKQNFEHIIDLLDLRERDRFDPFVK